MTIAYGLAIPGNRSIQCGFVLSISAIFHARFHFFKRFSRLIANSDQSVTGVSPAETADRVCAVLIGATDEVIGHTYVKGPTTSLARM